MCADTYIALRCSLVSQKVHIPDLEESNHYSSSYRTIYIVKIMPISQKWHTLSTLFKLPSLNPQAPQKYLHTSGTPYCMLHQNESFSKQNLQGATAASFCRILDREEALESSNAEL